MIREYGPFPEPKARTETGQRNPRTTYASEAGSRQPPIKRKPKVFAKKTIVYAGIIVVVSAVLGLGGWAYINQQRELNELKQNPSVSENSKSTVQELTEKVGKIVVIPSDEQPTVGEITDLGKLKDQAFYIHAQIGDQVLIFTQSKRAVLYRPSTGQVVNISNNIVLQNNNESPEESVQ